MVTPRGLLPALVTPFDAQGALDLEALERLVQRLAAQGADGFFIGGTTGEFPMLSTAERIAVIRRTVTCANRASGQGSSRSLTTVAHVGSPSLEEAIALARAVADVGADAVAAVPPYYFRFALPEVVAYFQALAESTPLPVVVYNIPNLTGVNLVPATVPQLYDDPRFVAVKHTSFNLYELERIKALRPEFAVLIGFDETFLGALAMGADGGVGSTYNVMLPTFRALKAAFDRGDLTSARALQRTINTVVEGLVRVGIFPAMKYALALQGCDCGACRRPFAPLNDADRAAVRALLLDEGVL